MAEPTLLELADRIAQIGVIFYRGGSLSDEDMEAFERCAAALRSADEEIKELEGIREMRDSYARMSREFQDKLKAADEEIGQIVKEADAALMAKDKHIEQAEAALASLRRMVQKPSEGMIAAVALALCERNCGFNMAKVSEEVRKMSIKDHSAEARTAITALARHLPANPSTKAQEEGE